MNNFLYYIQQDYALFSVTIPWMYVIYWFFTDSIRNPPKESVMWFWLFTTICTYYLTWWVITDESVSLYMVDGFFIYLGFYLWTGSKITPGTAYVLTYFSMWSVDMIRGYELLWHVEPNTWYYGVGGAGYKDGLCILPLISAMLIHYVAWRRKEPI